MESWEKCVRRVVSAPCVPWLAGSVGPITRQDLAKVAHECTGKFNLLVSYMCLCYFILLYSVRSLIDSYFLLGSFLRKLPI